MVENEPEINQENSNLCWRNNWYFISKDFEQASFDLFENDQESEIELQIKNLNLSNMTPIEALVKLSELQKSIKIEVLQNGEN